MSNKNEIDYVSAQVKAAESEVSAARARAEAARMQVETTQTRLEVNQEQLHAVKSQVAAAQSQAKAAEAQREAATVQAEAAIAQVEATREQSEAIKSQLVVVRSQTETMDEQSEAIKAQVSLMRTQTETLQDQLGVAQRQARSTAWLAFLVTLGALSLAALAGLAVYGFVMGSSPGSLGAGSGGSGGVASGGEASGATGAEAPSEDQGGTAGAGSTADVGAQLAPVQIELERANKSLDTLSARLGQMAARLVDDSSGSTKRIKVLSPPIELPAGELSWTSPGLKQWLAEGTEESDSGRTSYVVKGTVKRPVRPGQRITIDVYDEQWWPGGGSMDVETSGVWNGSIILDPTAPPERLRVTIWDGVQGASREYTFANAGATGGADPESAPEGGASAPPPPSPVKAAPQAARPQPAPVPIEPAAGSGESPPEQAETSP